MDFDLSIFTSRLSARPEALHAGFATTANAVRSVLERDLNQTAGAFKTITGPEGWLASSRVPGTFAGSFALRLPTEKMRLNCAYA